MSYDNNQLSKAVAHMLSLSDTLYVIECNEMNVIAYTFEKEGYQKPFANCVAWIKDNYMDMTGGDWCVSLFTTKGLLQYPPEEGSLTLELETPFVSKAAKIANQTKDPPTSGDIEELKELMQRFLKDVDFEYGIKK